MNLRVIIFLAIYCLIGILGGVLGGGQLNCFAQTQVLAEIDKTTLVEDDNITYKFIITTSENKLPQPQIPAFKDFVIISQAQSSSISFVKGVSKTILTYTFILTPTSIGKFKIEPSSIKIKDKTYSTDSFEIEVKAAKHGVKPKDKFSVPEQFSPGQQPRQSRPRKNQTESEDMPQYIL